MDDPPRGSASPRRPGGRRRHDVVIARRRGVAAVRGGSIGGGSRRARGRGRGRPAPPWARPAPRLAAAGDDGGGVVAAASAGRPTKRPSSRSRGERPSTLRACVADRQPKAPRRPPAGSSRPWMARASPASVRLRTIRARSTRLIWPFSSDTTTTTASVCSVMPEGGPMARPEPLGVDRRLGQRQQRPGRDDPVVADDHRAVVERRLRGEDRAQQVGRHVAVDHHAGLGHLLEPGLALEHDERALAVGRQLGRRAGDLGRDVDGGARLGRRQEPAERPDPPDALERAAQLGLEDDDEGEQADDRAGLEDLGQQPQVERDRQARRPCTRTLTPMTRRTARVPRIRLEQPVDEERGDPDVDDRRQVDLIEDRLEKRHRPRV